MRRTTSALAVAAAACALLLGLDALGLVRRLEPITLDARYSLVPLEAPTGDVVVAWIDQESLDFMDENGFSFPWPRSVYEAVLGYLAEGGARAVGFDILFDQRGIAEDDEVFGAALRDKPNTALAAKFVSFRSGGRDEGETAGFEDRARTLGAPRAADVTSERGYTLPIGEFAEAAGQLGFVNVAADTDKVHRHYELVRQLLDASGAPVGARSIARRGRLAGGRRGPGGDRRA
jgi:adenylate cyclase